MLAIEQHSRMRSFGWHYAKSRQETYLRLLCSTLLVSNFSVCNVIHLCVLVALVGRHILRNYSCRLYVPIQVAAFVIVALTSKSGKYQCILISERCKHLSKTYNSFGRKIWIILKTLRYLLLHVKMATHQLLLLLAGRPTRCFFKINFSLNLKINPLIASGCQLTP